MTPHDWTIVAMIAGAIAGSSLIAVGLWLVAISDRRRDW